MYCLNHIAQLGRLAPDLQQQGFRVLVVGASTGPAAEQAAAAFSEHLDLLTDPKRHVYGLYGFGRLAKVVQRSGTVVVDRQQVVRYLLRTSNPKSSLKKGELLDAVQALS